MDRIQFYSGYSIATGIPKLTPLDRYSADTVDTRSVPRGLHGLSLILSAWPEMNDDVWPGLRVVGQFQNSHAEAPFRLLCNRCHPPDQTLRFSNELCSALFAN